MAEIRGNKTQEFLPKNYFPNLFFPDGGDKTITGPRGAARRLTFRLGTNGIGRARRGKQPDDEERDIALGVYIGETCDP